MKSNTRNIIFPLVNIFGGNTGLSVKVLVELCVLFGLNESAVRTYLSRAVQNNIFKRIERGNKVYYQLTKRGIEFSGLISVSFRFEAQPWNGYWSMIAFSVPDRERAKRDKLRRKLTYCRYRQWYKGLWIRPDNFSLDIEEIVARYISKKRYNIFKSDLEDLNKSRTIAENLFQLKKINQSYIRVIKNMTPALSELEQLLPRDTFIKYILTDRDFVTILSQDPLLPKELLPANWQGDELRSMFHQFIAIAHPGAIQYVEKIKHKIE